jgi:6-phosphofructokinase 1
MKRAMVYIQSGGPTAVINTSLYGAIMEAKKHPEEISAIYGSCHGIEGLIDDDLIDLNQEEQKTLDLLKQTPGAILGTTRYKLPKDINDPQYQKILSTIKKHDIGYVFVNGGNDSMDTCNKLSILCKDLNLDCRVIGVPKTVDNDLALTDHSLGFPSAAKHVINLVKEVCIDAACYKKGKVFIIEIMGRNAGWLTGSVDLLPEGERPDLIYLPENVFSVDDFLASVKDIYERKGHAIAAISEGIVFERDASTARIDAFNHVQLGGAADALSKIVERRLDLPTRSIELSLAQRADVILASKVDQDEALECGKIAVIKALEGATGKMISIKRVSNNPYTVKYVAEDISKIANEEATVPASMMAGVTHMAPAFKEYLLPLVQGETNVKFKNGVFESAVLKGIKVR